MGESIKHTKLKKKCISLLKELGYKDIKEERSVFKDKDCKRNFYYFVDIYVEDKNRRIIIECGNIPDKDKINDLSNRKNCLLIIVPYNTDARRIILNALNKKYVIKKKGDLEIFGK